MTVVLGLVLKDGVIIASDSQVEFSRGVPVRRVNANKVYRLVEDRNIAIAGAGMISFMHKAIEGIRSKIKEMKNEVLTLSDVIDIAESVMASLHKMYNIERLRYLYGGERPSEEIDSTLIIGGVDNEGPHVSILFKEGISEPVDDYATIGSGAAYAEYLLGKLYDRNMSLEDGKRVAIYVIKEVEKIDPNVGGPVNVVVISKEKYEELSHEEVEDLYRELLKIDEAVSKLWRKLILGRITLQDIKNFLEVR